MDKIALGKRIEARVAELGLSKRAVWQRANMSPTTFYRLIRGDLGQVSMMTFEKLAAALETSVAYLVGADVSGEWIDTPAQQKLDEVLSLLKDTKVIIRQGIPKVPLKVLQRDSAEAAQTAGKLVPIYGKVAAGMAGARNDPLSAEPGEAVAIPASIAALPGRKLALWVTGNSMEPQLFENDIVVAWYGTQPEIRERTRLGSLMVITDHYNEEYVKHCYWDDEESRVILRSANPEYEDIAMPYESIRWTGLVVMTMMGNL